MFTILSMDYHNNLLNLISIALFNELGMKHLF